jgi:uncharacterized membrane protein
VFLQLIAHNPLWSWIAIGEMPVLDLLLLAYVVPAVFAFLFARRLREAAPRGFAVSAAVLGLVLSSCTIRRRSSGLRPGSGRETHGGPRA